MKTLETYKQETNDYVALDDFVLSTKEWKEFKPGTIAYRVRTYDESGRLVNREYVLKGLDNTHKVLKDMQNVAHGYFTDTTGVIKK